MATQGIVAERVVDGDALSDLVVGLGVENHWELLGRADTLFRKISGTVRPAHRAEIYSVVVYLLLVLRDDMPVHPRAYMEAANLHITPELFG